MDYLSLPPANTTLNDGLLFLFLLLQAVFAAEGGMAGGVPTSSSSSSSIFGSSSQQPNNRSSNNTMMMMMMISAPLVPPPSCPTEMVESFPMAFDYCLYPCGAAESNPLIMKADYVFGEGTGKCHVSAPFGRSDDALIDAVRISQSFIRLMADELCQCFGRGLALAQQLREPIRDIIVRIESMAGGAAAGGGRSLTTSTNSLNSGFAGLLGQTKRGGGLGGTGAAILIALLKTFLGIQPLRHVAIAADITLSGKLVTAGGLVTRVNSAISMGIQRLIVSREDEDEACRRLNGSQRELLIFAEDVFDLFENAIMGKSHTASFTYIHPMLIRPSLCFSQILPDHVVVLCPDVKSWWLQLC